MENKILSLYRDETKILTWFILRKIFFQDFLPYTINKSSAKRGIIKSKKNW